MDTRTTWTLLAVALAAALTALGAAAQAAPPTATQPATGRLAVSEPASPLAGLPSKPGPHIEKIKALGENAWLDLGSPTPDPKWGKARGRAWGGRSLTYAPDLEGAFFCGTGIHGFVKPDGHYMDDLWFYDRNAHRWICLYPGAHGKTLKLHLDEHGFEVNDQGEHIPVSYLSHAYGNSTYDPHLHKFTIIWCQCPWWGRAIPQRWDWLDQQYDSVKRKNYGGPGPVIANNKHPLFWDVATGKWARRFVEGAGPNGWAGLAEYVPSLKKTLFIQDARRAWLYDYAANAWTRFKVSGPGKFPGHNGCLDWKRDRVYSAGRQHFAWLDLKTGKWTEVQAKGQPESFGSSNNGRLTFDAASGRIVWHPTDKVKGNIRVYDPEADAWETPPRTFPDLGLRYMHYMMVHGFYDAKLNAHFYCLAGDSREAVTMLAYRYRKVTAK